MVCVMVRFNFECWLNVLVCGCIEWNCWNIVLCVFFGMFGFLFLMWIMSLVLCCIVDSVISLELGEKEIVFLIRFLNICFSCVFLFSMIIGFVLGLLKWMWMLCVMLCVVCCVSRLLIIVVMLIGLNLVWLSCVLSCDVLEMLDSR